MQLKRNQRGFTLIELLVVIAIIGILSSIVLIALRGARDKAKDARMMADMAQIRSIAELLYDGDYDALALTQADVAKLNTDITTQGGSLTIQKSTAPAQNYCAYTGLNEGKSGTTYTNWWCIDSTGMAKQTATNPSGATYCTATTFVCP